MRDKLAKNHSSSALTRASMLSGMRLSKSDDRREQCQAEFFRTYHPRLVAFFQAKGMRNDAEELASDLVFTLLKRLERFKYDPQTGRFRNYLRTVAGNACKAFWSDRTRRKMANGIDLSQAVARGDLEQRLNEQFDLDLLEEAKLRAKAQVSDRDWEIYTRLTETPITPDKLAQSIGIKRHALDVAKYRVVNRIRSHVRRLEERGLNDGNEE